MCYISAIVRAERQSEKALKGRNIFFLSSFNSKLTLCYPPPISTLNFIDCLRPKSDAYLPFVFTNPSPLFSGLGFFYALVTCFFFPHCCFLSLVPVFTAGWHYNKDVEHNVNGYKGGN